MPELGDATLVAALLAVDPALGGAVLRTWDAEAAREWLALLGNLRGPRAPLRRMPSNISDDRLIGGLDLTASLVARRRVAAKGLLAEATGGTIVVPFAERVPATIVSQVASALDAGEVIVERDGIALRDAAHVIVIALAEPLDDTTEPDDRVSDVWCDRLAFDLAVHDSPAELDEVTESIERARALLASVTHDDATVDLICEAAAALGVASIRASIFTLRAARAHAALANRVSVTGEDIIAAVRLVLARRATLAPALSEVNDEGVPEPADTPNEPAPAESAEPQSSRDPEARDETPERGESSASERADIVVAAVRAALPAGLFGRHAKSTGVKPRRAGRSGSEGAAAQRGRQIGVRQGDPRVRRLDVVATLQAAAPWQRLRQTAMPNAEASSRMIITRNDFRVRRFRQRASTSTIFVVDASGSAARARLAEAKGAVELLLSESYARRDRVSLIAFGGNTARCILPPTRALARARRELAGMAAGGGTPLAAALDLAHDAAAKVANDGSDAIVVLITDGGANIARDGTPGRERAMNDALESARRFRARGIQALVIDCGVRENPGARAVASAMGGRYAWLPRANARTVRDVVSSARRDARPTAEAAAP